MENRYRIIIAGKKVYKEIEVAPEDTIIRFGTGSDCDVRIRKDLFYDPLELVFTKDEQGIWNIMCSENLYISVDEVSKLMTLPLHHGKELMIRHQNLATNAFHITFLIDFDHEKKNYNRRFDISSLNTITIGNQPDNNITINGIYICGDKVVLQRQNRTLLLQTVSTQYGVYHNGCIVQDHAVIQEGDFFSIANISFCFRGNCLFTQNSNEIQGNGVNSVDSTDRGIYPKFRRNSRIKKIADDTKIEILDPPAIPKKPKNNILSRLLPSLVMVVTSIVVGMAGGYFILISLVSAGAGVVTAIISMRDANKDYKKELKERIDKYNTYISKKRNEITQARTIELDELQEKYISEDQEIDNLKRFSFELFDRRAVDEDFLEVRLGLGKRESKRIVDYKKQERLEIEDDLQMIPQELAEQYKYLDDAPIVCDLKQANAVGVIGNQSSRYSILKNMLVDICARQYHSDIKMFFVAEKSHAGFVYRFRMLPQVFNHALGIQNIVSDDNSRTVIFEYLYKELTIREQRKNKTPHLLIFLYDEYGFKTHPVSRFVDNAKDLGVTFVFFGQTRADIGQGCHYLINMASDMQGTLIDAEDGRKESTFTFKGVSDKDIEAMIQLLAPVYTEEISLEGSLTKNISLFELLNVLTVDDIDLRKHWTTSKVNRSIAAPIGVSKSGVIELDLHDKAHGPHGLVAGTTGAGKSELLQTYIMSMATLYHPYEVGFVIIDFKGGGMANQFADLPHLMGTITNIDGKEIDRSLRSIKAELQKRQRLFKEAEVNHIDKYIVKFRSGEVKIPLPHLILIVDEFAELKADQPEFMKELISAARIGRSLGVHLILATQKPSGQVDEQIWSNSRFKLCLKVQSQQDSNEVIKSPLAAEIKEPGRAYLQVGNNEIFELFQSAYSGAPEHADESNTKEFVIYEISSTGRRIPVYVQKKNKDDVGNVTQLDAMVNYIKGFCKQHSIRKLPDICLPPLPIKVPFGMIEHQHDLRNAIEIEWCLYDDPDNQVQKIHYLNLSNENVMIIGSAQTGKTNLLQTIIRCVATKYSPKEVNLYILDFASMILKNFEKLNHVGGVILAHEEEKCKNLFRMLEKEINVRKEKFARAGVSSYLAYREAGFEDLTQIVVLIDNLTVMKEMYLMDTDFLLPICRDGLSLGISVIVANPQTSGIGYKYLSNFEKRIALYCNDSTEYNTILEHCRIQPSPIQGRCLLAIDNANYEAQSFMAFDGEKEVDRVHAILNFVDAINQKNAAAVAKKIPSIPDFLTEETLKEEYCACSDLNQLCIGLDFADVSPVYLDWFRQSVLAISGQYEKSKMRFLNYLKKYLLSVAAELYVMDDYTGFFEDIAEADHMKLYSRSGEDLCEMLEDIRQSLAKRYSKRDIGGVKDIQNLAPIVLILHQNDAPASISSNKECLNIYKELLNKYKGLKFCAIFSNLENEPIPYGAPEVLDMMKKNRQFLMFEELSEVKLFDYSSALGKKYKKALNDSEGYLVLGSKLAKIKTICGTLKGGETEWQ